jgi:hypothetical protein
VIRRLACFLLLTSLLATACTAEANGSSQVDNVETVTTSTTTTTTLAPNEAIEEFRQCLEDGGLEVEAIPVDATGRPRLDLVLEDLDFSDPAVVRTLTGCASILENGALDLAGEERLRQAILEQLSTFSECMVDHGVEDFPQPVPGFLGVGSPFPVAEIPYSDPQFSSAVAICRSTLLGDLGVPGDTP